MRSLRPRTRGVVDELWFSSFSILFARMAYLLWARVGKTAKGHLEIRFTPLGLVS